MTTKVSQEQGFQILATNFSIAPTTNGYVLQVSASGKEDEYSDLFSVSAGVTRMVTGVASGSFYRLKNNTDDNVIINWQRQCNDGQGGGGGSEYILPIASSQTLGGVKVGDGLSIGADGTLSTTSGGSEYELPIASTATLGGVKIGDGLSIEADGTLSATGSGSGSTADNHTLKGVEDLNSSEYDAPEGGDARAKVKPVEFEETVQYDVQDGDFVLQPQNRAYFTTLSGFGVTFEYDLYEWDEETQQDIVTPVTGTIYITAEYLGNDEWNFVVDNPDNLNVSYYKEDKGNIWMFDCDMTLQFYFDLAGENDIVLEVNYGDTERYSMSAGDSQGIWENLETVEKGQNGGLWQYVEGAHTIAEWTNFDYTSSHQQLGLTIYGEVLEDIFFLRLAYEYDSSQSNRFVLTTGGTIEVYDNSDTLIATIGEGDTYNGNINWNNYSIFNNFNKDGYIGIKKGGWLSFLYVWDGMSYENGWVRASYRRPTPWGGSITNFSLVRVNAEGQVIESSQPNNNQLRINGDSNNWNAGQMNVYNSNWSNMPSSIYAPTYGGNADEVLVSQGENNAPVWEMRIKVVSITSTDYDDLVQGGDTDPNTLYLINDNV